MTGIRSRGIRLTGETLVCARADSSPLGPRDVSKAFRALCRQLKFNVQFHDLRHSHISQLLAAGFHPKIASERAGHASTSITMDNYSHVLPGMQQADRIDAALRTHLER